MYVRLRMKNWRSIDDATVELGPFTVLVGRNSSGKSNTVDALLFVTEVARDAATAVSRRGGITSIRRWSPSKPYDTLLDVRVAGSRKALDTDYLRHELVLHSGKAGAWSFNREVIESVRRSEPRWRVERKGDVVSFAGRGAVLEPFHLGPTTSAMLIARQLPAYQEGLNSWLAAHALRPVPDLMRKPQAPTEAARLNEDASNITTALGRVKRASVVQAMQRIVPGLADVRSDATGRYQSLVFRQNHSDERQPDFLATEMSDGALRALAIVVAALQMRQRELLVIEEPEVGLHPGAADVVYEVLHSASRRGAVLVTTHSPELLDRAKDEVILVCEYLDGLTKIGPLSQAQRDVVRSGLFSTAELMRSEDLRREGAPHRVVSE